MLKYKIVEKSQFSIIGKCRRFNNKTSYKEIPEFWNEFMESSQPIKGRYGVCVELNDNEFDYYIADDYHPYCIIPSGFEVKSIVAGTWAVFPCKGHLPESIQEVNTRIWNEWIPNNTTYRLAGNYSIEFYDLDNDDPDNEYSEIWVPVEKI